MRIIKGQSVKIKDDGPSARVVKGVSSAVKGVKAGLDKVIDMEEKEWRDKKKTVNQNTQPT